MQEVSKDLVRLCTLLHTKNELQSTRHTARHKERKLNSYINHKKRAAKRAELQKAANSARSGDLKKLEQIQDTAQQMMVGQGYITNAVRQAQDLVMKQIQAAEGELSMLPEWYGCAEHVPAKYKRMKSTDLKIMVRQQHIINEQMKLEIAMFTRANRKEIAAICKRNNWRVISDAHSAYYCLVIHKGEPRQLEDKDYLAKSREQIKLIASTQVLEEAMLNA